MKKKFKMIEINNQVLWTLGVHVSFFQRLQQLIGRRRSRAIYMVRPARGIDANRLLDSSATRPIKFLTTSKVQWFTSSWERGQCDSHPAKKEGLINFLQVIKSAVIHIQLRKRAFDSCTTWQSNHVLTHSPALENFTGVRRFRAVPMCSPCELCGTVAEYPNENSTMYSFYFKIHRCQGCP